MVFETEPLHCFFHRLRPGESAVEADVVAVLGGGGEDDPGKDAYARVQGAPEELDAVDGGR